MTVEQQLQQILQNINGLSKGAKDLFYKDIEKQALALKLQLRQEKLQNNKENQSQIMAQIIMLEKVLHQIAEPVEYADEDIQKLHTMHVDVVLSEENLFDPALYLQCGHHTEDQLQRQRDDWNLAEERDNLIGSTIIAEISGETYKDIPIVWRAIDVNGRRQRVFYNPIDNKFYTDEFACYVLKCMRIKFKKPACGWYYGEKPKAPKYKYKKEWSDEVLYSI